MNRERRKAIAEVQGEIESLKARVEELRDAEQDYYDNMPKNLQEGDKGQAADVAISALDETVDALETAVEGLSTAAD
jgi:uncharacterized coiled-coil DUF342 family protein